jgi:hypothetical protein
VPPHSSFLVLLNYQLSTCRSTLRKRENCADEIRFVSSAKSMCWNYMVELSLRFSRQLVFSNEGNFNQILVEGHHRFFFSGGKERSLVRCSKWQSDVYIYKYTNLKNSETGNAIYFKCFFLFQSLFISSFLVVR